MPNRLIREGLLESEAVLSVPVEARWLFVTIMLMADDLGLFEATEFKLGRKADVGRDSVGRLMQMLADVDLIRLYDVDGKRYGFIPRFNQRVQIKRTKHPMPPAALMSDDKEALRKINDLTTKTAAVQMMGSSDAAAGQPSEPEVEVERVLVLQNPTGSSVPRRQKATEGRVPACPAADIVAAYHEILPDWPKVRMLREKRQRLIAGLWKWVLTSTKPDGSRRAATTDEGVAWFRAYFTRARDNDFLMGRTPRGEAHANWRPDIDYLCTEAGMKQVIEKTKVDAA